MEMNDIWLALVKMAKREAKNIVDDKEALEVKILYDQWANKIGCDVKAGEYIQYDDKLYKVLQNHTVDSNWAPGTGTESLYSVINNINEGTIDDPIPYEGNMALESGKYYIQNDILYLCNRDTINPVYNNLTDLLGVYVEIATIEPDSDGSIDNPIPFVKGCKLNKDLYYIENDIKYLCILNSAGGLYHELSTLVGLYVIVDNSNYSKEVK